MTRMLLAAMLCVAATLSAADDGPGAPPAARPRAVPLGTPHVMTDAEEAAAAPASADAQSAARFTARDRWVLAGYNNEEVIYSIIVSNEDTRVLHCTALMNGWYLENGRKQPIADRQSITVLPGQPMEIGNWMDLDQPSGATYTVKCRPT